MKEGIYEYIIHLIPVPYLVSQKKRVFPFIWHPQYFLWQKFLGVGTKNGMGKEHDSQPSRQVCVRECTLGCVRPAHQLLSLPVLQTVVEVWDLGFQSCPVQCSSHQPHVTVEPLKWGLSELRNVVNVISMPDCILYFSLIFLTLITCWSRIWRYVTGSHFTCFVFTLWLATRPLTIPCLPSIAFLLGGAALEDGIPILGPCGPSRLCPCLLHLVSAC